LSKLKPIFGYAWAVLALIIVIATFAGNRYFSHRLASATGITVSPRLTGGDIMRTDDHGSYRAIVHRPVFDGLIGERSTGFIQIDWESSGALPPVVAERIDLDREKPVRLLVRLDTRTAAATATDDKGSGMAIEHVYRLPTGWAVRVILKKTG